MLQALVVRGIPRGTLRWCLHKLAGDSGAKYIPPGTDQTIC